MDQVKKIAGILFAQRFWILCGVITLIPLGGWFTVTAAMQKKTQERTAAIKSKTDNAKTLLGKQGHPNDVSHKLVDDLRVKVTNEVGDAWQIQYDRQKELLVWPAELEKDFIEKVDPLRPLEKIKPPVTSNDEILNTSLRDRYRDYIFAELPKLAKKIDALWVVQEATDTATGSDPTGGFMAGPTSTFGGPGTFPGAPPGGPNAVNKGPAIVQKVLWDSTDQAALRARYDWKNTKDKKPRTIDVLYVQEDLWILSALMDIIANTNQGSTGRYNSIIKQINYINLGREVGGSTGGVMRIHAGANEGGMMGGSGMMDSAGGMGMSANPMMSAAGGMSSAATTTAGGAAETGGSMDPTAMMGMGMTGGGGAGGAGGGMMDPAQFRYVDQNYKPVSADTLRTAITSETRDPNNAFLVVAKRIPIRLGLTVDQRKLNRFISECGNAPLMVEVRQVRFNRQGGSSARGGGGGAGGMMSSMGMTGSGGMSSSMMGGGGFGGRGFGDGAEGSGSMSGMGMPGDAMGMGMGMGSGGYGSSSDLPSDVSPNDKPVEIYGVVYLYNPVDLKKLGIESAAAAAMGATPAAGAPAAGAPAAGAPAAGAPAAAAGAPAVPAAAGAAK